jgi:hypothetical protein
VSTTKKFPKEPLAEKSVFLYIFASLNTRVLQLFSEACEKV